MLTGHGLKDPDLAISQASVPAVVDADLKSVLDRARSLRSPGPRSVVARADLTTFGVFMGTAAVRPHCVSLVVFGEPRPFPKKKPACQLGRDRAGLARKAAAFPRPQLRPRRADATAGSEGRFQEGRCPGSSKSGAENPGGVCRRPRAPLVFALPWFAIVDASPP